MNVQEWQEHARKHLNLNILSKYRCNVYAKYVLVCICVEAKLHIQCYKTLQWQLYFIICEEYEGRQKASFILYVMVPSYLVLFRIMYESGTRYMRDIFVLCTCTLGMVIFCYNKHKLYCTSCIYEKLEFGLSYDVLYVSRSAQYICFQHYESVHSQSD